MRNKEIEEASKTYTGRNLFGHWGVAIRGHLTVVYGGLLPTDEEAKTRLAEYSNYPGYGKDYFGKNGVVVFKSDGEKYRIAESNSTEDIIHGSGDGLH